MLGRARELKRDAASGAARRARRGGEEAAALPGRDVPGAGPHHPGAAPRPPPRARGRRGARHHLHPGLGLPEYVPGRLYHGGRRREEREEGGVAYAYYSDGYDGGFDRAADDYTRYMAQVRLEGARTLSGVLRRLRRGGRPVTCAVYTLLMPWVADVAREHGVAATAVFWIQPATALAAYYHYFRGGREAVMAAAASRDPSTKVRIPGLPPLLFSDLPSFLAITSGDDPFACVIPEFRELIDALERDGDSAKPPTYVLANTFDAMEPDTLASLRPHIEVVTIGPVLSFLHDADDGTSTPSPNDLFDHDGAGYLDWLDTKPAKSVVYISFGSTSVMSKMLDRIRPL